MSEVFFRTFEKVVICCCKVSHEDISEWVPPLGFLGNIPAKQIKMLDVRSASEFPLDLLFFCIGEVNHLQCPRGQLGVSWSFVTSFQSTLTLPAYHKPITLVRHQLATLRRGSTSISFTYRPSPPSFSLCSCRLVQQIWHSCQGTYLLA